MVVGTLGFDAFIQEMVRLSAMSLVLNSGKKGLMHLASGNKFTKFPLSHQQLTDMLLRAAPEQYRSGIRKGQAPPPFRYQFDGEPFVIQADASGGTWSIRIARERALHRGMSGRASVSGTSEPAGASRASGAGGPGLSWSAGDEPPWGERSGTGSGSAGSPGGETVPSPPTGGQGKPARRIRPVVAMPVGKAPGTVPQAPPRRRERPARPSPENAALLEEAIGLGGEAEPGDPSPLVSDSGAALVAGADAGWLSEREGAMDEAPGRLPLAGGPVPTPARPLLEVAGDSPGPTPVEVPGGSLAGAPSLGQAGSLPGAPLAPPTEMSRPLSVGLPLTQGGTSPVSAPTTHRDGPPRIDAILRKLVAAKGSDLHLTAGQIPRCRIAGRIQPVPGEAPISGAALRDMLHEIMPARVQDEFERTKDGDFAHAIEGLARFRVNVGVDRHGVFAVLRVIPNEILKPEDIGLPKKVLDLCFLSKGMVLVTGPTGSGKSTTLATLIDVINSNREDHIITIEDPIEFVHPDNKKCLVRQREVGEHTGSFKRALKAALREDPDIVLVGEMRDLETIAIAIETAATGHLVFGTLHTSTAPSTVDRIIDQFPANQQEQIRTMLSDSLKGVIAQTLCKRIDGGRVAAFEILICNRAVANLIREGKTFQLYSAMQTSKAAGSITLNASLLQLVKQKIITPEEAYIRAVNKEDLRDAMARLGIRASLQTLDE